MLDIMSLAQLLQGLGGAGGMMPGADPFAGGLGAAMQLPAPLAGGLDPAASVGGAMPAMPGLFGGMAPQLGPDPFAGPQVQGIPPGSPSPTMGMGPTPMGAPVGAGGGLPGLDQLLRGGGAGLPKTSADQRPIMGSGGFKPGDPKVQAGAQSQEMQAMLELLLAGRQAPPVPTLGSGLRR